MSKQTPKQIAQEHLLTAMQAAFNRIDDDVDLTEKQRAVIHDQADKQMKRIEKMFGFVEGSWGRGV